MAIASSRSCPPFHEAYHIGAPFIVYVESLRSQFDQVERNRNLCAGYVLPGVYKLSVTIRQVPLTGALLLARSEKAHRGTNKQDSIVVSIGTEYKFEVAEAASAST
jgi:hypothetical protein